jgi:hypothetical protein
MGGAPVETCALLWPATDAKYWTTFFVFSVFPAPLSPLENRHHTAILLFFSGEHGNAFVGVFSVQKMV